MVRSIPYLIILEQQLILIISNIKCYTGMVKLVIVQPARLSLKIVSHSHCKQYMIASLVAFCYIVAFACCFCNCLVMSLLVSILCMHDLYSCFYHVLYV